MIKICTITIKNTRNRIRTHIRTMEMLTAFHAPKSGPFFWWQRRDEQVLQWTPGPFPSPASFGWVLAEILDHKFMNLWGIRRKQHEKKHTTTWKNREKLWTKTRKQHGNNMQQKHEKNDRWFPIWPGKGGQLDRCGALRNPLRWVFWSQVAQ